MAENNQFTVNFDLEAFIKRHMNVNSWQNERSQVYNGDELNSLLDAVIAIFKHDNNALARISPPCTVVGDIHGQYRDLMRILGSHNQKDFKNIAKDLRAHGFSTRRYVFLGDYVDRGNHSTECITLAFALKVWRKENFVLLRGNHETKSINFAYGFREEMLNHFGADAIPIWEKYNEAFSWMPMACVIGQKILCMHGGISPQLTSLSKIEEMNGAIPDSRKSSTDASLVRRGEALGEITLQQKNASSRLLSSRFCDDQLSKTAIVIDASIEKKLVELQKALKFSAELSLKIMLNFGLQEEPGSMTVKMPVTIGMWSIGIRLPIGMQASIGNTWLRHMKH